MTGGHLSAPPARVHPTILLSVPDAATPYRASGFSPLSQFGNSGDKIAQTVAVARYILQEGSFSATSGLFGHNWGAD